MTKQSELNISNALPDRTALVFDKRLTPDARDVGFFASFPSSDAHDFKLACFSLSPIEDETTKNAEKHATLLSYVFKIFKTSFKNVMDLIGYSCVTSMISATKSRNSLIGCAG